MQTFPEPLRHSSASSSVQITQGSHHIIVLEGPVDTRWVAKRGLMLDRVSI
ncbi:hypothetical protein [Novosphingobium sp. Gsoil 351]|uniref:hypothetical protein n=1 Tax=Novosphingobium sp. Gsoil 351 TaxID=2675225 RepID=UPI0018A84842